MDNKSLISYLKKSVITGLSKSTIVAVLSLFFIPLIISQIGMEIYGVIMLSLMFSGVSSIVDLGISKSVTLLLGNSEGKSEKDIILSSALFLNGFLIIAIGIVVLIVISFDVPVFGSSFEHVKYTNSIIIVGFLVLVMALLRGLATSIMEAYYLMHYVYLGNTLSSVCLYGTIYLFALFNSSIQLLLIAPLIPLSAILLYFLVVIVSKTDLGLVKIDFSSIKRIMSTAFKFLNLGILNSIIYPGNKYLLIFISGNSAFLGIFDISLKIATAANNLLNSLSTPLFGVFSNFGKAQTERIYNITKKTTALLFGTYVLGIIIFYFVGNYIAAFIDQNNDYIIASSSLILLIGVCFSGVSEPAYRALLGTKRLREAFYLKLIAPIANIIIFFLLYNFEPLNRINLSLSAGIFLGSMSIIIFIQKEAKR